MERRKRSGPPLWWDEAAYVSMAELKREMEKMKRINPMMTGAIVHPSVAIPDLAYYHYEKLKETGASDADIAAAKLLLGEKGEWKFVVDRYLQGLSDEIQNRASWVAKP